MRRWPRKPCKQNQSGSDTPRAPQPEVAVDVVANFTTENPMEEERAHLMGYAVAIAAERLSDLVGYLAEDLTDKYL